MIHHGREEITFSNDVVLSATAACVHLVYFNGLVFFSSPPSPVPLSHFIYICMSFRPIFFLSFSLFLLTCACLSLNLQSGPDEYVMQMTTFLERRYLATIHATIVSAQDQEKDYALAVK